MSGLFIHHHREKLLNAIVYFVRNVKYCGTVKLLKLLNFLDFEHYRQTGRSVTGLRYQALPKGPVPQTLHAEITNKFKGESIPFEVINILNSKTGKVSNRKFHAQEDFKSAYFTPRELEIMAKLVELFRDAQSNEMIDHAHATGKPWEKVYANGAGKYKDIPYELALEDKHHLIPDRPTIDRGELSILKELRFGIGCPE